MISVMAKRVMAASGAACAVLGATVIPWSHYGDCQIVLWRYPNWQFLAAGILVALGCATWSLFTGRPAPALRVAVVVAGAWTVVWAAILMSRYDQAELFFSGPIPMVMPKPWLGAPIVVLAVLALSAAAALPSRTKGLSAVGIRVS